MSINWVMVSPEGKPLPLPSEKFLFSAESVNLSLFPSQAGAALTQTPQPGTEYSGTGGSVFVSNKRIVWISSDAGPATRKAGDKIDVLKSLSVSHSSALDSRLYQPWFGAAYWEAMVIPAADGGLEGAQMLRLTFKERGAGEFVSIAQEMQARLGGTESGRGTPQEDLPLYTPPDPSQGSTTLPPGPSGLSNSFVPPSAEESHEPTEADLDAAQVARTAEEDERIRETRQGEMPPPPAHHPEAPPGYDV